MLKKRSHVIKAISNLSLSYSKGSEKTENSENNTGGKETGESKEFKK